MRLQVQFGITLGVFQKAEIALTKVAHPNNYELNLKPHDYLYLTS